MADRGGLDIGRAEWAFSSRRSDVCARNGVVATSQPLAAQAGLRVLQAGGNAADAAVATAAVLAVVEPMSTGVGGDAFALYFDAQTRQVTALNGSGRSPAALTLERLGRGTAGRASIPANSPHSITVPGTVAAWEDLLDRHGTMSLAEVMQPAIAYARDGFPVSPLIAAMWQWAEPQLLGLSIARARSSSVESHAAWPASGQELLPKGRAPRAGELVQLPELALTLETIAQGGTQAFYRGRLAERIAAFVQEQGGALARSDMAAHHSTWDEPIALAYRGLRVWECPPNGQGLAALLALGIAEGFDLARMNSLDRWHLLIEAMRLGFADAQRWVADPAHEVVPVDELLAPAYLAQRRQRIHPQRANPDTGSDEPLAGSDTVYLAVVDGKGNACSFINSLYHSFGTGLVVPGTGIALHNRGSLFSLDERHPNRLAPGKRPYHTIIPALITTEDPVLGTQLWACLGVMGGFMQPQGHLQVIVNLIDRRLAPQATLDEPRFCLLDGEPAGRVAVEAEQQSEAGFALIQGLRARGHQVVAVDGYERVVFGAGQVILRDATTGVLIAGSDPRRDGCAVGW